MIRVLAWVLGLLPLLYLLPLYYMGPWSPAAPFRDIAGIATLVALVAPGMTSAVGVLQRRSWGRSLLHMYLVVALTMGLGVAGSLLLDQRSPRSEHGGPVPADAAAVTAAAVLFGVPLASVTVLGLYSRLRHRLGRPADAATGDDNAGATLRPAGPSLLKQAARVVLAVVGCLVWVVCAVFLVGLLMALPARSKADEATCQSTLMRLATDTLQYAQDHGHRLPAARSWLGDLGPYRTRDERCPEDHCRSGLGYAMSADLSSVDVRAIPHPQRVVLLYEACDGVPEYRHFGGMNVAYADGSSEWLPAPKQ